MEFKLPERFNESNKGTYGKVLNIAGSKYMRGAAYLSSAAALTIGCGYLVLCSDEAVLDTVSVLLPEAVLSPITNLEKDIRFKSTSTGPHRDDIKINIKDIDVKKFGSQGQQRTAALSLKLAEIEIIKEYTGDTPILLLDDVLSELDMNRQKYLLENLGDTQTIITCTGLDEFVNNRFEINKCFKVSRGSIQEVNNE